MSYEQPTYEELARDMLLGRMRDISEDCWCAGWMMNLEFTLRGAMQAGKADLGWGMVKESDLIRMKRLHELAGGWWTLPEGGEFEDFVTTEEWMRILSNHRSAGAPAQL